ncbi:hypothetical protein L5515_007978 [Caenorhabditis briggsae]|uniref:Ion transport domain-containing protein n=1 Tax=Caenorhabditis briggsae TaxID=6238 RepID=A0AAE9A3W3_CAEBR|nr:hypothetical protein L3Y34_008131 [Caenorhabditis briggsae]UMM35273.1 hypothetical protein L5515_007978 [Caenorhabditis briggsae]
MGSNPTKVADGEVPDEKLAGTLSENRNIYKMLDMHGGGVLIKLARQCKEFGCYDMLDAYLDQEVRKFMYNAGKGKLMPIAELVKARNQERNAKLGAFSRKKGKGKSGPNILDEFDQGQAEMAGDLKKALKLLDGGGKGGKSESKYREMVWNLDDRGSMGEHVLAICLLQGTALHNIIAKRLIHFFPKLINDICTSEDYYGLSPLHMAIVNQDAQFTSILLRLGADLNQRCYGAFFCAEDQKTSRTDSLEHEFVELTKNTNYTGSMYFGEYPLSFAVCTGHHDLFRMLLAKKANLNAQDTNGNTALHLCVIHDKMDMLDAVLDAGGNPRLANKQNLTALTLAARLAKKTMFNKILQLECEKVWTYGVSQCVAIPLTKIDTIDEVTGEMNDTSALSLVVYGESTQHLELMDGLIEQILDEKWKAYGRALWFRSLLGFIFFYCCFVSAYMLRPSSATTEHITRGRINDDGETESTNSSNYLQWHSIDTQCHLMYYSEWPWYHGWFRLGCEVMTIVVMLFQILFDLGDIRRIGFQKWFNFLKAFPAKLMFKGAFLFILISIPCRLACSFHEIFLTIDNTMAIISVLLVTQHFLYYMRAIPFVGPFVLMVYTIIATDLVRFAMIYSIFLVGFSQSFYLIFTSCERDSTLIKKTDPLGSEFNNIMENPVDALLRTFIMTIGEFSVLYREMAACDNFWMKWIGKIIFLIFETFVSILQFNLLIAMMTRTYETIFLTRKEWKRQWAQVILMLEMGLTPESRKMHLLRYTRPTGINKRVRSYVVVSRGDGEKTENEELAAREAKEEQKREERKQLLKKKQREHEIKAKALALMSAKLKTEVKKRRVLRQQTVDANSRL